jgi:hypothetical protein
MPLDTDDAALISQTYAFAKERFGQTVTGAALRAEFERRGPGRDLHRVMAIYQEACALLEMADDVAAKARLRLLKEDQALRFLEDTCPGFSKVIYADAYVAGWYRHASDERP